MKLLLALSVICLSLLTVLGVACAGSCAGPQSKKVTLFPAAELAWPAVHEDLDRGLADGLETGDVTQFVVTAIQQHATDLGAALAARDVARTRLVPWTSMVPWAERGVKDKVRDGDISDGVAVSLFEQLKNFNQTILDIQGVQ